MACISRVPQCADTSGPDPISSPLKIFGAIFGVIGGAVGVLGGLGALPGIVAALGGAAAGGAVTGALAVISVLILIGLFVADRCTEPMGLNQCIAGCVSNIVESFSDAWEYLVPFAAKPNRVDVTVKSFYWDFLEQNQAYVFCSTDPYPMRSEIMLCYYFTDRVCNAGKGSIIGATVGGVAGVIAGAATVAAIGCATIILCIFALILAAIIAAAAAIVGAFIGGNIAQAVTPDNPPAAGSGDGNIVKTGQFVTLNGNMIKNGEDNNANVLWFVHDTQIHGKIADGTHQPYSYCDIDDQFPDGMDGCKRAPTYPPIK
jgi:hypothetical protein